MSPDRNTFTQPCKGLQKNAESQEPGSRSTDLIGQSQVPGGTDEDFRIWVRENLTPENRAALMGVFEVSRPFFEREYSRLKPRP